MFFSPPPKISSIDKLDLKNGKFKATALKRWLDSEPRVFIIGMTAFMKETPDYPPFEIAAVIQERGPHQTFRMLAPLP